MQYRFVRSPADYSDLASGAVLHSAPGRPAFPVRLASELFQRARSLWLNGATPRRCVLYDPCCGTGYLVTVTALLHGDAIERVIGSDVDGEVLDVAERNLALLTPEGLRKRIEALTEHVERFGKDSHRLAKASAERLLRQVEARAGTGGPPEVGLFRADVLDPGALADGLEGRRADIVLADTPYGVTTRWAAGDTREAAATASRMLSSLHEVLGPGAMVVLVLPKGIRPEAPGFERLQRFRSGHREALFWRRG